MSSKKSYSYEVGDEVFIICDVTGDESRPPSYFEHFDRPYVIERGTVVGRQKGAYGYLVENEEYSCRCQPEFLSPAAFSSAEAVDRAEHLIEEMRFRLIGLYLPTVIDWAVRALDTEDGCWRRYNRKVVREESIKVLCHMAAQLDCDVSKLLKQFPAEYGLDAYKKTFKRLVKDLNLT